MQSRTQKKLIKAYLRQLFLKSRERSNVCKRDAYTCQKCGKKQSKKKGCEVKINVDHVKGIDVWEEICNLIYDKLLCSAHLEDLQVLCTDCHAIKTAEERQASKLKLRKED